MLAVSLYVHLYVAFSFVSITHKHDFTSSSSSPGGVAANKSMIMYMIGQVRIGMDLSRVTLPTFILEKRSLLEMYADFLAHPDIFAK